ncbi:dystroglycan-related [Anaeramoeba flamelloides]|uniref:Dystroglycan-related n=1 Tax=Anaeramoeba flamelloides TaxID=1746091 RepID=A0AAV7ZK65_9EUKA|nr:dystroglycan-related [Anaeramoeba flamelloides]
MKLFCVLILLSLVLYSVKPTCNPTRNKESKIYDEESEVQQNSVVGQLSDGTFVFVYQTYEHEDEEVPGDDYGIKMKLYKDDSFVCKTIVNDNLPEDQHDPRIAITDDDKIVITYETDFDTGDKSAYFKIFNSTCDAIVAETLISDNQYYQLYPDVTLLSNGNLLFVWENTLSDDADPDSRIYARRFDIAGDSVDANDKWAIAYSPDTEQKKPRIVLQDNDYVTVVFALNVERSTTKQVIRKSKFDVSGDFGNEPSVIVSTEDANVFADNPFIAKYSDNSLIVVWEEYESDGGDSDGIYGQFIDTSDNLRLDKFKLTTEESGTQKDPKVVTFEDHGLLGYLFYTDNSDDKNHAKLQTFGYYQHIVGDAYKVSPYTESEEQPFGYSYDDNQFVVSFTYTNGSDKNLAYTTFTAPDEPYKNDTASIGKITSGPTVNYTFPDYTFIGYALEYETNLESGIALPDWLEFDGPERTYSGKANNEYCATTQQIELKAWSCGMFDNEYFDLHITDELPTTKLDLVDQDRLGGRNFEYTFDEDTFYDEDSPVLEYTAELKDGSALPDWMEFDGPTRTFSGTTPNIDRSYVIRVTASDECSNEASKTMNFLVETDPAPILSVGLSLLIFFLSYFLF